MTYCPINQVEGSRKLSAKKRLRAGVPPAGPARPGASGWRVSFFLRNGKSTHFFVSAFLCSWWPRAVRSRLPSRADVGRRSGALVGEISLHPSARLFYHVLDGLSTTKAQPEKEERTLRLGAVASAGPMARRCGSGNSPGPPGVTGHLAARHTPAHSRPRGNNRPSAINRRLAVGLARLTKYRFCMAARHTKSRHFV